MPTIYIIYEHFIPIHNMRVTPSFRLAKGQKKNHEPKRNNHFVLNFSAQKIFRGCISNKKLNMSSRISRFENERIRVQVAIFWKVSSISQII